MKKLFTIIFLLLLVHYSCSRITEFFCGELEGDLKALYQHAERKYVDKILIERIPCEAIYINAFLLDNEVDSILVNSLHQDLYNQQKKIGWQTILVYDKAGNYLFSHSLPGQFYQQSGD